MMSHVKDQYSPCVCSCYTGPSRFFFYNNVFSLGNRVWFKSVYSSTESVYCVCICVYVVFVFCVCVCRFGASILVNTGISLRAFTTLAFNPQCFMQYENSAIPPSQWTNVR